MMKIVAALALALLGVPAHAQTIPSLRGFASSQLTVPAPPVPCVPAWLPLCPGGVNPNMAADFVDGFYYGSTSDASFSAWLSDSSVSGTFTRPYAGTYWGSNGLLDTASVNVPRFEVDYLGHPQGLLMEPFFDTHFLWSQQFQNAAWSGVGVAMTDNSVTAPDGTTTGSLMTGTGSGSAPHVIGQTFSQTAFAAAVFARPGTTPYVQVSITNGDSGAWAQAICDLTQGGITEYGVGASPDGPTIAGMRCPPAPDYADGWHRPHLYYQSEVQTGTISPSFGYASAPYGNTYLSNGAVNATAGETLYLWGASGLNPGSHGTPAVTSYVSTTTAPANGGGDDFVLSPSWLTVPMTFAVGYGVEQRLPGGFPASGYYGTGLDSFDIFNPPLTVANHYPSNESTPDSATTLAPGVNGDAVRFDSTIINLSNNGNANAVSPTGPAATAPTHLSIDSYEGNNLGSGAGPIGHVRSTSGWASGLTDASLLALSHPQDGYVPSVASVIISGDTNWDGYPGMDVQPGGCLLADWDRYGGPDQGTLPSQTYYATVGSPTGHWSVPAAAISNANPDLDTGFYQWTTTSPGNAVGFGNPQTHSGGHVAGALSIMTASINTSTCAATFGTPHSIPDAPFFTGSGPSGTVSGDFTVGHPVQVQPGLWQQALYGYLTADDANTSLGLIFCAGDPTVPSCWGGFIVIANGDDYNPVHDFSEANIVVDPWGNDQVFARDDATVNGANALWRVTCPAGLDPRTLANWKPATWLAFNGEVGMPDVISLGDPVLMWNRAPLSNPNGVVIGYGTAAHGGVPWLFPSFFAAATFLPANLTGPTYWYSQSAVYTDNTIVTALAHDGLSGGNGTEIDLVLSTAGINPSMAFANPANSMYVAVGSM